MSMAEEFSYNNSPRVKNDYGQFHDFSSAAYSYVDTFKYHSNTKFSNNSKVPNRRHSLTGSDSYSRVNTSQDIEFYTSEILRLIKLDDFDDGELGQVHYLIESLLKSNVDLFQKCFQEAWVQLAKDGEYDNLYNFVCVASSIEYSQLGTAADCLLFAALALKNEDINDAAIRAIESWSQPSHLRILKDIRPFETRWLECYREEVIEMLGALDE
ncbi:hypothetical protein D5E83_03845 [Vibrio parahaemolyticus]|nr:hypothetical protein D5E83_03845 [Vibrio parahaemolyticus]